MDFDPVQILIVVIAMVAGFVQWLWKLVQEKSEAAQRQTEMEQQREERGHAGSREARRAVEERPVPARPAAPPAADGWGTLRELLEKAMEVPAPPPPTPPPQQPQRPAAPAHTPAPSRHGQGQGHGAPPPLPTAGGGRGSSSGSQSPATRSAAYEARAAVRSAPTPKLVEKIQLGTPPTTAAIGERPVSLSPAFGDPNSSEALAISLRAMLRHPQALRHAVLMNEILGPPKALQSADGSVI